MKILFTRFPLESRQGGAEIQTISLMEGLVARGHAVAFAGSCPTLLSLCKERHIPSVEWDIGKPPVTPWLAVSFLWRRIGMKRKLRTLLAQFADVDAVCMLSLSEKLLLTPIAHARKKKVLWIEHDRIGRWLRSNPHLRALRRQARAARIVTVSTLSKRLMTDMGFPAARITAIPNGIDPSRFGRLPARQDNAVFTIGCVARLTRDKGVHVLTDVVHSQEDIVLTIVGDGPEKHRVPNTKNIRVWPALHDMGKFYREIDLLVLPSIDNDPFGMAAAEAMLCGTPVIVTDQCGIAGYLNHGEDALIVRANDAFHLASAVTRLRDRKAREAIARKGQETARSLFSAERMVDAYEALLRG